MPVILPKAGWNTVLFTNIVLDPLLLVILLMIYFLREELGFKTSILVSLFVLLLLIFPLSRNFKNIFILDEQKQASDLVLYPFSAFSSQIEFSPNMRMFISKDTWSVLGDPWNTKNRVEILSTFNAYFGTDALRDNFMFSHIDQDNASEILSSGYDYVLGSVEDMKRLESNLTTRSIIEYKYDVYFDSQNKLFLLIAR